MKKTIYLDYAAATPLDPEVLKAMEPFLHSQFYNPSANYLAARAVRQKIEAARTQIAGLLGARPAEVVFTAGATEANNLAIGGIMKNSPKAEVLVSAIEHESVLEPAKAFNYRLIPVDENGTVDLAKLAKMIRPNTALISVMLINNELGTIQPLKEIAVLVKNINRERQSQNEKMPLYLHTDVAQAGNFLDLHVSRLGVDLMSLNGGKVYGPKQSGALFIKSPLVLAPLIVGGGQERGLRSGTPNPANIAGLAAALGKSQLMRRVETGRILDLRVFLEEEITKRLPTAQINGHSQKRAPHLLSITFSDIDNERLMMSLDEAGIQTSTGSACSASSDTPSHVLKAIGHSDQQARSTLRISLGRQTTKADIQKLVECLVKLVGPS